MYSKICRTDYFVEYKKNSSSMYKKSVIYYCEKLKWRGSEGRLHCSKKEIFTGMNCLLGHSKQLDNADHHYRTLFLSHLSTPQLGTFISYIVTTNLMHS